MSEVGTGDVSIFLSQTIKVNIFIFFICFDCLDVLVVLNACLDFYFTVNLLPLVLLDVCQKLTPGNVPKIHVPNFIQSCSCVIQ